MSDSPSTTKKSQATLSRRQWLTQASTVASLGLAGCLFTNGDSTPSGSANTQAESDPVSSPTANSTTSSENTTATPDSSPPSLEINIVAPETVETGIEETYTLSVTNTGTTATTVTYGIDMRRPQSPVSQTRTTTEVTLEPDVTQTESAQPFSNWETGPIVWTAWATADGTRVTATAGTTVTLSTRPWGGTYQPATGHVLSVSVPTLMDSYTGTRADGSPVTYSTGSSTQLAVVTLLVRNAASERRRTPHAYGFHLRDTARTRRPQRAAVGAGTTQMWTDLAPGEGERWTLIYEVPTGVTQSEFSITHTSAGYYTDGGWQVSWG